MSDGQTELCALLKDKSDRLQAENTTLKRWSSVKKWPLSA